MQTLLSSKIQSWLIWFLKGTLLVGFFVLFARLFDLQLIRGNYFKVLAEQNRIRRVPIAAARGKIFARGGELLVGNREVKKKLVFNSDKGYEKLEDVQGAAEEETITEWIREYVYGTDFAHISGYLGQVSESELGKVKAKCNEKGPMNMQSLIGRSGLEEQYDCVLKGIDGEELVEVDALGKKVRVLGRKEAISGQDITITIDFGLQRVVAEQMRGKKGAVVVSDASGEILALYSSPSYDPNVFMSKDTKKVTEVLENKNLPLFNRAISGIFHPGSIYKPIVAIAALEEGVIDKNFLYEDRGQITFDTPYGIYTYSNWFFTQYGGVEGKINLQKAIARSTDTFFYEIGGLLGIDKLVSWSQKFGLNKETGIDLPSEAVGLVPSPSWKMDVKRERWFLGNTYHMSIGQGDIALTPIGIHGAISAIASGGIYCQPHLLKDKDLENFQFLSDPEGFSSQWPILNFQCEEMGVKKESIDLVKEGMVGVCSTGGTGYTFFDFENLTGVKVGCKTGTAETDDGSDSTHAWFVAFAPAFAEASAGRPAEEPEIIATVLVEKGGEGSKVAGPIVQEIFNYWFGVAEKTQI